MLVDNVHCPRSLCVRLPTEPRPSHYAVRYFATFTLYSQIDIWNVRHSCQYLIDFIRWPSKVHGATFFLHSGTNVVKSACVVLVVMALTLVALYVSYSDWVGSVGSVDSRLVVSP